MRRAIVALALLAAACEPEPVPSPLPRELEPVARHLDPAGSGASPQPHRDRPRSIASASGRLFVALQGTDTDPGSALAVLDAETLAPLDRIEVGSSPTALAAHPGGRFLVVASRFASFATVVDAERLRVVGEVAVPFYTEGVAFSPDGAWIVFTNRWKDAVIRARVRDAGEQLEITVLDEMEGAHGPVGLSMPNDPLRVRFVSERRALVASESALSVTLFDVERGEVIATHVPNAPVTDVATIGSFVYVLHTGSGSGHPPDDGFDGDFDGAPGDGTANVTFQDVQNEIDVLRAEDLSLAHRYTSDSICCGDYRDVDPDHPEVGLTLGPDDAWPPERVAFLPPRETWIVAGAMPERAVPFARTDGSPALAVVFSGSSEVQTFDVDRDTGALRPRETGGGLYRTGHGALDAIWLEDARRLVVVNRLGESLSLLALDEPAHAGEPVVVGDVSDGAFPATDAELGEAFNTMSAAFGVDGDQTCVHCHRDGTPVAKPVSMPLLEDPEWGVRNPMAYRGAADSRPWFVEAAMDEDNFFPVINEFARRENFCCEQMDMRIWSRYPSREECLADRAIEGCGHVLDCLADPPPECAERGYGGAALTRDLHFRAAARAVLGRDESFGDALYTERIGADGEIERRPIPLGFDGITRAVGAFLLADSRLLPNPNAPLRDARAELGASLYASARTGCASCHPLPVGATVAGPFTQVSLPYVVSPTRHPRTGADVDLVNPAFLGTFPDARQTSAGLRVGVTSLRGLWDRDRFLHHGLARSLREALATPGHPALMAGERGFNERDGQPDTHGSTSALTADELEALVAYLETL